MPTLSIIILTFNEKSYLEPCLSSIFNNPAQADFEVIVVDNGSLDGSAEYVRENWPLVKLVVNKENLGVAKGRNQGIKEAHSPYVMFLDSDAELTAGALDNLLAAAAERPRSAVIGPKIVYPSGKLQRSARTFPTPLTVLWRGTPLYKWFPRAPFYRKHLYRDLDLSQPQRVDWVLGACQLIRRRAMDEIGLLDEKYFFGYEDIEFCRRAGRSGWEVWYDPRATAVHRYQRRSARGIFSRMKREHLKSVWRFWREKGRKYPIPNI